MEKQPTIRERIRAKQDKQGIVGRQLSGRQFIPRDTGLEDSPETMDQAVALLEPWKVAQRQFLEAVRAGATFRMGCEIIGCHRETYKHWRKNDPMFEAALKLAIEERSELLIEEARRRAVEGVVRKKCIVVNGELHEWEEIEYSDKLLQFLLSTDAAQTHPEFRPTRKLEVEGKVDHFMKLAESAEESQAEYDRKLDSGEEDIVDAEFTETAVGDSDSRPDVGPEATVEVSGL